MQGVTELITAHEQRLQEAEFTTEFSAFHLTQIRFLQHERLVHLLVMLFVILVCLLFLALFLLLQQLLFMVLFAILLVLSAFYVFHYFKLENTVIEWYFIYNEHAIGNR